MSAMAPQADVLLGAPDAQHPFLVGEPGQELVGDVVLAPASCETDQFQYASGDEAVDVGEERLGHRVPQRRGGVVMATVAEEEARHPTAVGQPGCPTFRDIRSIDSTSKTT